ncbi:MAG: Zn-dependent hydrolase [Bacteroidota bacterium]
MKRLIPFLFPILLYSCGGGSEKHENNQGDEVEENPMQNNLNKYTSFRLSTDLSHLDDDQKEMVRILIDAAKIMDDLFWYEAYGDKDALLAGIEDDLTKEYVKINYGPWDRLEGNKPFIETYKQKPAGANFYPRDMTKQEFEAAELEHGSSQYTLVRRNEEGELYTIWYHEVFAEQVKKASDLLRQAADLAKDEGLKKYLSLRSEALLTDEYRESDLAWMDMKTNAIDVVIGPIENYEDQLYNYKSAHEAYVLIKDLEWSRRLEKYAAFLPELQEGLPVSDPYKQEKPGTDADLNAYDAVYYSGDCNAGSKTIAINLPNDETVQLEKGTRRLQLKNTIQAKFDKILIPISRVLIAEDQRKHIKFDAFFANTMFHEVAHGLGIKNTINGKGTVRTALQEHSSAIEEGKADILGLYMITQLFDKGEIEGDINDYYVTFMTSIFRSVRFSAASSHGKANMIRFNFFKEFGAFERDSEIGTYKVNFDKMQDAMNTLSEELLTLQGDGDYEGVSKLVKEKAVISPELQSDLNRLIVAEIPIDITFEQGVDVLGL